MASVYTPKQALFIQVFTNHIQSLLKSFLNLEPSSTESINPLNNVLNGASTGVGALSAAVAIAGVAGAAPSFGTSLIGASAGIVLLQTFSGGYQFVKRQADNHNEPFRPDETKLDDIHLSLSILLRRVAYLTAVRYRHFIDEILEEKSISTFAIFVAERAIKALEAQSSDLRDITTALNAEDFLAYFLSSAKLSFLNEATKIDIKEEYSQIGCLSSTTTYAKWACSRPGLAIYNEASSPHYTLYASASHNMLSGNRTTLHHQYGFITAPYSELTSPTAAVTRIKLKPLTPEIMHDILQKHQQHFCVYYQISRQDVSNYLAKTRHAILTQQLPQTLNEYLSETLEANVIAACHDDTLRNLDLSGGNFSETLFNRANLSDCNLQDTFWTRAHLNEAHFKRNDLTRSNFQYAFAEKSIWEDIHFSGDFSHAKMNGSQITSCLIGSLFNQFGTEWELAQLNNVRNEDIAHLLNVKFEKQRQENIQLINQNITTQLDNIDHESIPSYLNFRWNTDIDTPSFQQIKETYIPLNTLNGVEEILPLTERFETFLNSDDQFLLLHGDVGSGKTLSVALWQEQLMHRFQNQDDWLPVYIRLIDLQGQTTNTNFLKAALQTVFLNPEKVQSLMEHFRCIIICDALEESELTDLHQILEQCSNLNAFWKKGPPKILVTAQTRYLLANSNDEEDYHDILRINEETPFPAQSECILQPFNKNQIQQYLKHYDSKDMDFSARYNTLKQNEFSVTAMSKNPLMLHIICEVLNPAKTLTTSRRHLSSHSPLHSDSPLHKDRFFEPSPSSTPRDSENAISSRLGFYNAFFKRWYSEEKHKLFKNTINYANFQKFIQEQAFTMYSTNQDWIEKPYTDEYSTDEILETTSHKTTSMLTPFIVSVRDTSAVSQVLHYEFGHLSFKNYALAKKLFQILISTEYTVQQKLNDWNLNFLTTSPDVFNFLFELIKSDPSINVAEENLLYMINASKGKNGIKYERAASNAITLLNRWFDFATKLSPQALANTHLSYADLSQGHFDGMDFSNCDLTGVTFADAQLSNCIMHGANLKNIRFSNYISFIDTDTHPNSFTVHPHDNEDIIAYDIKPVSHNDCYHDIAISSLAGQISCVFKGHKASIGRMAITRCGNHILLASAENTGTIRIWEIPAYLGGKGREINKLEDKTKSILSIAWSENGRFLASTGEYGTVQIWDVAQKTIIWQSEKYDFTLRCVIWDHTDQSLIAAGDDGQIRIWSETARQTIQAPELLTHNNTNPIYSLAVSTDGKNLIAGCANGVIYIQRRNSPSIDQLEKHTGTVTSLACKNDRLASGSDDTTVRLWDLDTHECVAVFPDPENRKVNQVSWLSNDNLMSGVEGGNKLRIWSNRTQSLTWGNLVRAEEQNQEQAILSVQNCDIRDTKNISRTTAQFLSERGALISIDTIQAEPRRVVKSNSLKNLINSGQSLFTKPVTPAKEQGRSLQFS